MSIPQQQGILVSAYGAPGPALDGIGIWPKLLSHAANNCGQQKGQLALPFSPLADHSHSIVNRQIKPFYINSLKTQQASVPRKMP
jgi:hypothetical protein